MKRRRKNSHPKPKHKLITVDTGYACAGVMLDTHSQRVIEAAPIFKWMVGKGLSEILRWKKIRKIHYHDQER